MGSESPMLSGHPRNSIITWGSDKSCDADAAKHKNETTTVVAADMVRFKHVGCFKTENEVLIIWYANKTIIGPF